MCWRRKTGRLQKIALKTEFYDRINASGKLFRFLIFIICGWFIDHTKNFRQCKDTKIFSDSTLVCITIQRGQRTINVCKELIPLFPKNEKPQNRVNSGVFGTPSGVRTLDTLRTLGVCIPSYHFISRVILSAIIVENSTDGGYHNTK